MPVGAGRFARAADDRSALRASPEFDSYILGLAETMRDEMRLGEGPATDLLAVGVSATDYVGHGFGTRGAEMCIQLLALDRALGDFFQHLDRERIDYVVVLTADHGGLDLPERSREQAGGAAARVDPALGATRMGEALGRRLGLRGPVLLGDGPFGDMWIDRALPARTRDASPRRGAARLSRPSPGRIRPHPRRDRGDALALRPGRQLDDPPARPRLLRSAALGRFLRDAEAAHHPDRRRQPRLGRHPWQRLGL